VGGGPRNLPGRCSPDNVEGVTFRLIRRVIRLANRQRWWVACASMLVGAGVLPGAPGSAAARAAALAPAGASAPGHPGRRRTATARPKRAAEHGRSGRPNRGRRASRASRAARAAHPSLPNERRVASLRSGLPNVQAQGALVLDENGRELYARNADGERPIASISKLAATLAVMDRGLELEGLSTITRADIEVARGGARSRLFEGITLSNRDLLHAALMGSDNRAIPALGRAVRLSPSQLAAEMTAKARSLGLKHTRFHDPTGLSVENVSTPRETILLLQAVMRHPILGPITRRVEYQAHPVGRPAITYVNTYRPAIRGNVEVLGGKTGYNDDARYCLVLAAKVEGKTCFMSFLSNEGKMTRFGDVARVADWMVARRPKALAGTATAPGLASAGPVGLDASSSFGPVVSAGSLPPAPADPVSPGSEPTMLELPREPYESAPPTPPAAPTAPTSP